MVTCSNENRRAASANATPTHVGPENSMPNAPKGMNFQKSVKKEDQWAVEERESREWELIAAVCNRLFAILHAIATVVFFFAFNIPIFTHKYLLELQ